MNASVLDRLGPPAGWEVVPLGRLVTRSRLAGTPDKEPLSVFLDAGVVPRSTRPDNFNALGEDLGAYLVVKPGDLVFNKLRTWQGGFGCSRFHGIVSPAYFVCRPAHDVLGGYLDYLLHSQPYLAELRRVSKWQPPSQFDTGWEQLKRIACLLPDCMAQQQIAAALDRERDRVESLLRRKDAQQARFEGLRAAVVSEATQGLAVRRLKHGWRVVDCKHRTPTYLDTGCPVISTREVRRGVLDIGSADRFVSDIDASDLRARGRDPRRGDIVYSRNATVGVASYVDTDTAVCMGQDVVLITRRPRASELLAFVLNWGVTDQVERASVGSTFHRINVETIRDLVVPFDDDAAEQDALHDLRARFAAIDAAESKLVRSASLVTEYRDALITEAVTGKLDVTKLSDAQLDESAHAALEGETPEVLAS